MPEEKLHTSPGDQFSLSFVSPDYIDTEVIEQPEPIWRYDSKGYRFYYVLDDNFNPTWAGSVTHIKDKVLGKPEGVIEKRVSMGDNSFFRYVSNRQKFGTLYHILCAELAMNGQFEFGDSGSALKDRIESYAEYNNVDYTHSKYGKPDWFTELWKGLQSWAMFLHDYQVKPLAIEISLFHPLGFANTIDYIVEMNEKNYTKKTAKKNRKRTKAVLDIKSGHIFPDHAVQLSFNAKSIEHHYPELYKDIGIYANFSPKNWWKSPTYTFKDQTDAVKIELELLPNYVEIWQQKFFSKPSDIKAPTGTMVVGPELSQNYINIPIDEFIKEKHKNL